ncbi:MAG: MlaA family lipoprotein [Burkholderiales bacterium]
MKPSSPSRLFLPCAFSALFAFAALPAYAADEPLPEEEAALDEDEEFFVFDEEDSEPAETISDPLEGLNRVTFAFNDKLYRGVLKPIARGLRIVPEPLRIAGNNFFTNLGAPVSSFSALLQGDLRNCATELGRFVLNSTAGLAGFLDVATDVGLMQDEEDLGQTLARYGVGHGFYFVVPFLGPSSLRDAIGTGATGAINPVYDNLESGEILAYNLVSAELVLSVDRDTYESLYDQALDPYAFFRSAWVQNRAGRVRD